MSHPDNLARGLSVLAVVVASLSALFAGKTYLRAGARIKVTLESKHHYPVSFVDGALYDDVVTVTVRNSGLAPIQVTGLAFDQKGVRSGIEVHAGGRPMPCPLAANSDEEWEVEMSDFLDPKYVDPKRPARFRITVQLGGGKSKVSRWTKISAESPSS